MKHTAPDTPSSKRSFLPPNERKWIYLSLGLAVLIITIGCWLMLSIPYSDMHTRNFKAQFKNFGSLARICLFFVFSSYVFTLILQKRLLNHVETLMKAVKFLMLITRKWHTSIAIITIGLTLIHVVGAFLYGFKVDFSNITGLLAFIVLLPVPISGLLRYRRLDKKWHLRFGLGFAFLFLLHAFL